MNQPPITCEVIFKFKNVPVANAKELAELLSNHAEVERPDPGLDVEVEKTLTDPADEVDPTEDPADEVDPPKKETTPLFKSKRSARECLLEQLGMYGKVANKNIIKLEGLKYPEVYREANRLAMDYEDEIKITKGPLGLEFIDERGEQSKTLKEEIVGSIWNTSCMSKAMHFLKMK